METTDICRLPLRLIRMEVAASMRADTNQTALQDYADAMRGGAVFEPVDVFFDGQTYWLADGLLRLTAAEWAHAPDIAARVHRGSRRDAFLFAASANAKHGVRRTRADKRQVVSVLLDDPEWRRWSDREIARRCHVSDKTVARVRKELSAESPQMRRVKRGGAEYDMNTARIGSAEAEPSEAGPPPEPTEGLVATGPPGARERQWTNFGAIVAAPPWGTMSPAELRQLPVDDLAAPDAALWLWASNRFLLEALTLAQAWGFTYADLLTWVVAPRAEKDCVLAEVQQCVLAVRGARAPSLPYGAACQKGVAELHDLTLFYQLVEELCPGPKVELFARRPRPGWVCLGDGSGSFSWDELSTADAFELELECAT